MKERVSGSLTLLAKEILKQLNLFFSDLLFVKYITITKMTW